MPARPLIDLTKWPYLRPAQESDLPAMLEIYRPYVEQTAVSFEYALPTLAEFTQRFHAHTARFPWLVWAEKGEICGYAYAGAPWERAAYGYCAECSVYIKPEQQRRQIGANLYEALEQILTLQGYRLAYALITTENSGSLRFHEALGYAHRTLFPNCGYKFGRWHGVVWMEKQLNPFGAPKAFPASWRSYPVLRHYQPSDCPALEKLFYDTVHTVCAKDYTPEALDAWAPVGARNWNESFLEHRTLVAELDGEIVGFGDADGSYLDRLYVSCRHQRRKIATLLCDALETAMPMETHASLTARPFFEKRGYRVLRRQQVERNGQLLTNFVMKKEEKQ